MAIPSSDSGRAAAMARRAALSAGKAALPPATERLSGGRRGGGAPVASVQAAPAPSAPMPAPVAGAEPVAEPVVSGGALSGRHLSMQRRRLMAAGKTALPPRAGAPAPTAARAAAREATATAPAQTHEAAPLPASPEICNTSSCREQARARRALLSQQGRGNAPPAEPSRPARQGSLEYAPKVVASGTQAGQRVTGLRIGQGPNVTGDERGTVQPVSGTQYIAADGAAAWRAGGPKVGQQRTAGGQVVSGTLVRSQVRITGDEAGSAARITGEAEQTPDDDLTGRSSHGGFGAAQFQRQANPHGSTVFGTNLGRSMRSAGSRERQREAALEATERGVTITGSAVGRSTRVTGDEGGACRGITGSQYLAPARRQAECGYPGGGTAPAAQIGAARPDPVTAAKVAESQSWGGQRITGVDVEHNPRVTGDAPGSCAVLTGSQYQGRTTAEGWCDPAVAGRRPGSAHAGSAQAGSAQAGAGVTGDTPVHDRAVTGTGRGAARDITGTPYYRADVTEAGEAGDPVAALAARFSVGSPQRAAHLKAAQAHAADVKAGGAPGEAAPVGRRITGSFAVGASKLTGNTEFQPRPRASQGGERGPAHVRLSGEGSSRGSTITGDSWSVGGSVTGVEGNFAADRNLTLAGGKAQAFAGAGSFKAQAKHEEPRQLVTGMFGYFSKTGARVTLSGGAQS